MRDTGKCSLSPAGGFFSHHILSFLPLTPSNRTLLTLLKIYSKSRETHLTAAFLVTIPKCILPLHLECATAVCLSNGNCFFLPAWCTVLLYILITGELLGTESASKAASLFRAALGLPEVERELNRENGHVRLRALLLS